MAVIKKIILIIFFTTQFCCRSTKQNCNDVFGDMAYAKKVQEAATKRRKSNKLNALDSLLDSMFRTTKK